MDPSIVELALAAGNDKDFEIFGQIALQIALGIRFEPTGGMHDGGQDGFLRSVAGRTDSYVQISAQETYKPKIKGTITRLKNSGRNVSSLTYVSSLNIPQKDIVEAELERETGVEIRIRDQRWIVISMSMNPELELAFKDRYSAVLAGLHSVTEHHQKRYATAERLSVLVYLENHEKSESSDADLLTLAVDAAIFMALKDTDPEAARFLSEAEIVAFVEAFFPQIKTKGATMIPTRLAHLCTKHSNPRVRRHKQTSYALPYEVRSEFSAQNALLEQVDAEFWRSVNNRTKVIAPDLPQFQARMVEDAIAHSLTRLFEQQGLNLMAASQGIDSFEEVRTYEYVHEALSDATKDLALRSKLSGIASELLRRVFYSGTDTENQYLFRLFKLYSVEFIIKGDEKVWRYFRSVIKKLKLIVGADIIVRALSETCVLANSQTTQNVLRIIKSLNGKLFLSEHVLKEVYTHLRAADKEFETFYKPWCQHITLEEAKQSSRILIRAYFYAHLEPSYHSRSPANWDEFLGQFGGARLLRDEDGERALATYLQVKFGMDFLSKQKVGELVQHRAAKPLADKLDAKKNNTDLALNDAYMMLYVQESRNRSGETFDSDIHGFSTWWLTEEHHAVEIARNHGLRDRVKMHPQFLMNYISAIPGIRDVAEKSANSFPTVFGLRITNRVGDDVLKEFLKKAVEAVRADQATAQAKIRQLSNRLMARRP